MGFLIRVVGPTPPEADLRPSPLGGLPRCLQHPDTNKPCRDTGFTLSVGWECESRERAGFILVVGTMLVRGQPKGCPYIVLLPVGTGFTLSV